MSLGPPTKEGGKITRCPTFSALISLDLCYPKDLDINTCQQHTIEITGPSSVSNSNLLVSSEVYMHSIAYKIYACRPLQYLHLHLFH